MTTMVNRQLILARRPDGPITPGTFAMRIVDVQGRNLGKQLVRVWDPAT